MTKRKQQSAFVPTAQSIMKEGAPVLPRLVSDHGEPVGMNDRPVPPLSAYDLEFERSLHGVSVTEKPAVALKATTRVADLQAQMVPLQEIQPTLSSRYLVKGWFERGALSVVYGESNVGKTFFALDLAFHIAASVPWHGIRVADGQNETQSVLYVAGEGGSGVDNRVEAMRREHPIVMQAAMKKDSFVLMKTMLDLCGPTDALAICEALKLKGIEPALIVIDTLSMAFGGGDENTAKDMGAFVQNCRRIRTDTGAHVMVIHHSGKDSSKGARGSGSLRAASDTEIELTRNGQIISAAQRKQRDLPIGDKFAYTLKVVSIGEDGDGEAVTSAVVVPTEAPEKVMPQLKGQALIAMQAFGDALALHGVVKTGEDFPTNRQCVLIDHWRDACKRHSLTDGKSDSAARTAFSRAMKALQEQQVVRILDGFAWRYSDK